MTKQMLIDAAHPEETRVLVVNNGQVEDFDFETSTREQLRGNIYLAKVTRVEPSLQAGFVDYGGNRHGFLAFGEIHPDYYQIPAEDREAVLAEEAASHRQIDDDEGADEDEFGRERRTAMRRYKIQEVVRRRQVLLVQVVKEERGNKGAALTTYLSLAGRYCVLMPNTPRGGGISRKITAVGDRKRLKKIVAELELPQGMGLIIRTAGAKRTKTEIKRDYEYLLRLWDDIRERTLQSMAPALIHEEDNLVKRAIRDHYDKDIDAVLVQGEHAYREVKDFAKMLMPSHARKVQQYKGSTPLFARLGVERQLGSMHDQTVELKSGGYLVINQTEALVAIDVNSGKSTRERSIESTALKTNLEAADEAARQMRMRDLAGLVVIDFIDMEESRNDRAVEKRLKDALRFDRARIQMGKISMFGLMEISRQRRRTGVLEGSSHVCESCQGIGRVRSPQSAALGLLRDIETLTGGRRDAEVVVQADSDTGLFLLNEKRAYLGELEASRGLLVRVLVDSSRPRGSYNYEIIDRGEPMDEPDLPVIEKVIDPAGDEDYEDEDYDGDEDGAEEGADSENLERGDEEASSEASSEANADDRSRRRRRRRRGRREDTRDDGRGEGRDEARHAGNAENGDASSDEEYEASDEDGEEGSSATESGRRLEHRPDRNHDEESQETRRRRRRGRRGGRRRRRDEDGEGNFAQHDQHDDEGDANGEDGNDAQAPEASDASVLGSAVDAPVVGEEVVAEKPKPRGRRRKVEVDAEVSEAPVSENAGAEEPSIDAPADEAPKKPVRATRGRKPAAAKAVTEDVAEAPAPVVAPKAAAEPAPEPVAAPTLAPTLAPTPGPTGAPTGAPIIETPKPEGPKRTGWWAREAKKLFGKSEE